MGCCWLNVGWLWWLVVCLLFVCFVGLRGFSWLCLLLFVSYSDCGCGFMVLVCVYCFGGFWVWVCSFWFWVGVYFSVILYSGYLPAGLICFGFVWAWVQFAVELFGCYV